MKTKGETDHEKIREKF